MIQRNIILENNI